MDHIKFEKIPKLRTISSLTINIKLTNNNCKSLRIVQIQTQNQKEKRGIPNTENKYEYQQFNKVKMVNIKQFEVLQASSALIFSGEVAAFSLTGHLKQRALDEEQKDKL